MRRIENNRIKGGKGGIGRGQKGQQKDQKLNRDIGQIEEKGPKRNPFGLDRERKCIEKETNLWK